MYQNGFGGVAKDYQEALKWYRKAVDQGNSRAQYNLGLMYIYGLGVAKDRAEARKWFQKAADQGHKDAESQLRELGVVSFSPSSPASVVDYAKKGDAYYYGDGVPRNYEEAVKWYKMAAEQGDASAQSLLGHLYKIGRGVASDYEQAIKWYKKAADQGHEGAKKELQNLGATSSK